MSISAAMTTAPTAIPVPNPGAPASTPAEQQPAGDTFDRRLDAAHRQQRQAQPSSTGAADTPAPAGKPGDKGAATAHAPAHDNEPGQGEGEEAGMLAAAMLALLGQRVTPLPVAAHAGIAVAVEGSGAAATDKSLLDGTAELPPISPPVAGTIGMAGGLMTAAVQPERLLLSSTGSDARHEPLSLSAALGMPAATTAAATAAPHVLDVASPAGTPAFAQELGQQVAWLGGQDIKQARIRLHPEELGQLDVKVSVAHDRVDVTFAVQHPAAVHAVQQTLAQLDSLLAQHGLALGHAEVGQQQARGEHSQGQFAGGVVDGAEDDGLAVVAATTPATLGLLDTFA